jgi:hypothetical protein
MARCARCDIRQEAAVFVGSDETTVSENQLCLDVFRRLLLQIGGANIAPRIAAYGRLLRRHSPTKRRVGSFLLSTAARGPNLIASLAKLARRGG